MYFLNKDIDLKNIKIQEEELSEVKWVSKDELKYMVSVKKLNKNQMSCFNKACDFLEKINK